MLTDKQKEIAQRALELALQGGCQAARINLCNSASTTYEVRNMQLDNLFQATENALQIQLFVDGRYGSVSTNRLNIKELEPFISNGIDMVRFLAEDRARTLPDPSLYYRPAWYDDLKLCDDVRLSRLKPEKKLSIAMQACDEMMGKDSRLISATTCYSDGVNYSYLIDSAGFEGETGQTCFTLSAEASVRGEGDERPCAFWYDAAINFKDLFTKDIGAAALQRALERIGHKKCPSARMPMLVDNRCSDRLFMPVIDAIHGAAIQQKNSFLLGKLYEKVFSDLMTVSDDPHIHGQFGARNFDAEGVRGCPVIVVWNGRLDMYYLDTYYANKLNMRRTVSTPSTLSFHQGKRNCEAIMRSLDRAILVTGFNGGNCNRTTGDFSYGIEGFYIEHGEKAFPISEMNITGNMLALWNSLVEAGNDALTLTNRRIPALLFDAVDFSGA